MDLSQLIPLVRDLGITGVTLLIILLRLEPKLEQVVRSVDRLTDAVQVHAVTADRRQGRADREGFKT